MRFVVPFSVFSVPSAVKCNYDGRLGLLAAAEWTSCPGQSVVESAKGGASRGRTIEGPRLRVAALARRARARRADASPRVVADRPAAGRAEGLTARPGRGARWNPAPPSVPPLTDYRVYSNTGAGGPINYGSPVATVTNLSYLTSALTYPGTWSFGVRAYDAGSGLEEQNVDAVVTIILDAAGNDITNQPSPPTGLRAFALAGGLIRVEWTYPANNRANLPAGFHVYIGTGGTLSPTPGTMAPVTPCSTPAHNKVEGRGR